MILTCRQQLQLTCSEPRYAIIRWQQILLWDSSVPGKRGHEGGVCAIKPPDPESKAHPQHHGFSMSALSWCYHGAWHMFQHTTDISSKLWIRPTTFLWSRKILTPWERNEALSSHSTLNYGPHLVQVWSKGSTWGLGSFLSDFDFSSDWDCVTKGI